jgi:hypothetical protein
MSDERRAEKPEPHTTAARLIIAAAEQSGLLREVAIALRFIDIHETPWPRCPTCELRDELADAFDAHACLPDGVIERFHGDGICIGPFTDQELEPYLE